MATEFASKWTSWFSNSGDTELDIDDPLNGQSKKAIKFVLFLVFGVFGLAALFPIEGAVIGSGQVAVESRVKTISHPAGGVLSELLVRDGDRVEEGAVLMRFDSSVLGPTARTANLSREQLLARKARLETERDGRAKLLFPPELTANANATKQDAMTREQQQFALRRQEQAGTLSLLNQRVRQYREQIRSYNVQIGASNRQLALIEPELDGLRDLFKRGLVTVNRLNQMERTAVQLTAQTASLQANIAQTQAQISETQEQILNASQSRRVEAAADLSLVLAQLNEQDMRVASASDSLDRSTIRAPQAGVVDKLAYSTIGSAVPAGQPIAQIVPDRDLLIIQGQVSPADVDQLTIGQKARVRFSTLDQQLSPEIDGKLMFVSAERTDDPNTGASYYRVRIEIGQDALNTVGGNGLRAGMPVEIFLQTGSRSMLSYVTKPFFDQLRYAMRQ